MYHRRRSSNANGLRGQNPARFPEIVRPFKRIICDDVSEFESHMPSQAVDLHRDLSRLVVPPWL